jgi:ABC-type phosphate transport system substrate-binding protein
MINNQKHSSWLWKLVTSIATTPLFLGSVWVAIDAQQRTQAQAPEAAPAFQVPAALPQGTALKIEGSSSMAVINQGLKKRFEETFPGTTVNLASSGTNEALQALLTNAVDVAAIGRPLTEAEKAQGLKEIPVSREKIALIVSSDNPFKGNLTSEQFAKIFRGEFTNWSQVGGPNVPIRFIDRPATSDTRQALSQYPVFQAAPFKTGSNATQVRNDDTGAVVQELGQDGISYAIAGQVLNQPNVSVLPMHETLPSDPRYPYSQPRSYVYKGTPNPGVLAFIGFATSAPGQEAIAVAKQQEATTVQQSMTVPAPKPAADGTIAPAPAAIAEPVEASRLAVGQAPGLTPLLWLLLPLLGLPLLLWRFKGRGAAVPPVADALKGRMILTPRNARAAYAYWEVPEAEFAAARELGGRDLKLRLYDVTDGQTPDPQSPPVKEFDCVEGDPDLHLPIAQPNRDYAAELGYLTADNQWLRLARSNSVRVPGVADQTVARAVDQSTAIRAAAGAAATQMAADIGITPEEPQASGVTARFSDMTGAMTGLAGDATKVIGGAIAGGTAAIAGVSPTVKAFLERQPGHDQQATALEQNPDCRIILVPWSEKEAYVYWEVADSYKQTIRDQGGQRLMVRIHDVTNLNFDHESPHSTQTYVCDESDQDKQVIIPVSDRDYIAELGYFTDDNRWLQIVRSSHVRVAAAD